MAEHVQNVQTRVVKRRAVSCSPNAPSTSTLLDDNDCVIIDNINDSDDAEVHVLSQTERNNNRSKLGESSCSDITTVSSNGTRFEGHDESDITDSRREVLNARKMFDETYKKFLQENNQELKGGACYAVAATHMKNEKQWVNTKPRIGHIPGVEIKDPFSSRAELLVVGLHHQSKDCVDSMKIDGKEYAISIVDLGRNANETISPDSFVYCCKAKTKADRKLEGGNLALKNSMDQSFVVRVIRIHNEGYVYAGLYSVSNFWLEKLQNDQPAYMFEMTRIPHQLDGMGHQDYNMVRYQQEVSKGYYVHSLDDVSDGKEKHPIRVVNEINNERLPYFTYIANMQYPKYESGLKGCSCINGCSDDERCCCVIENREKLPFNEEGRIVRVNNSLVRECGPSCICPPSCLNRVSQHGIRYRLEVFKTKSTGWGVRSLDLVLSGGFICEYVGEFLSDKEAEKRINEDEYLFDLSKKDGFTIDALKFGNVGRFINHSCSPNLWAQKVLYDFPDERIPHLMFFATEDLPPLTELTYDYKYSIGRVCDAFGNIKIKNCYCGFDKCRGRLY